MSHAVALVTGGSHGIGAAVTKRLRADGYRVVVLDQVEPEDRDGVEFHSVDLRDAEAARATLAHATDSHEITRLVNNVGVVRPAPVGETSLEDFADVLDLNARAALLCLQAVLPAMRRRKEGRIVSITSRAVLGKGLRTAYAASKGALEAMTRTWALELAPDGITVNAVAPGPIGTEAFFANNPVESPQSRRILEGVPVGRLGTPEDVAHAVSFFLDEGSSFVTGQTLFVCGGLSIGIGG
jgi:NAD(P)-dependent dehydrogenase (short-subunit alcohol dehydrogenase family)